MKCCPYCSTKLEECLGWEERGEVTYTVSLVNAELNYELDEVIPDSEGRYFCRQCGAYLLFTHQQAKEALSAGNSNKDKKAKIKGA